MRKEMCKQVFELAENLRLAGFPHSDTIELCKSAMAWMLEKEWCVAAQNDGVKISHVMTTQEIQEEYKDLLKD